MAASPIRSWLYRSAFVAVICGLLAMGLAQVTGAQLGRRETPKGPRALGLVELAPSGKARLIPVAIMVDGKFYDASAYKASPVPFAIWSETVYEAERTGVSEGLFTVSEAVKAGDNWFAQGKWRPAGSAPTKVRQPEKKPVLDEDEGPPKLRRAEAEKPQPAPAPASTPPATPPASAPPVTSTPSGADTSKAPQAPPARVPDKSSAEPGSPAETNTTANDVDPNRPILRRGRNETLGATQRTPERKDTTQTRSAPTTASPKSADKRPALQLIPAISDAGGPDPRPYAYDLKPDEEQKDRKKMLALAAEALQKQILQNTPVTPSPKPATGRASASARVPKPPQPSFDGVQFHAFDLWNTNEPVFVLSAQAHVNRVPGAEQPDLPYFITLVAKENIYGELRILQSNVTDSRHLDVTPRLELIDAVDADGDGRGELLFREISDAGSAWGVYRAGADQLFPLFQGTPTATASVPPEQDSAKR